jgi:uncharacterized protein YbaR (Trm112 family)
VPLLLCPNCKTKISTLAGACPSCGRPLAMVTIQQTARMYRAVQATGAVLTLTGIALLIAGVVVTERTAFNIAGSLTTAIGIIVFAVGRISVWRMRRGSRRT